MFVGSGAVEAGCRAVIIGQGLKLSGMRWSQPGATGILPLRCQGTSNRWEEIWQRPHNQTSPARPVICQRRCKSMPTICRPFWNLQGLGQARTSTKPAAAKS